MFLDTYKGLSYLLEVTGLETKKEAEAILILGEILNDIDELLVIMYNNNSNMYSAVIGSLFVAIEIDLGTNIGINKAYDALEVLEKHISGEAFKDTLPK
jgi:hypothetical protein